jgi:hypothetical protein
MKKIVELIIKLEDLELDGTGVDLISLVENPAIQADFLYFGEEKFVEPQAGEKESEFISRCMPVLIGEGYDVEQAAAICYTTWDNFSVDTSALPPYVDQDEPVKKKVVGEFSVDEEQRVVLGPAMIPNKLIKRTDEKGLPYYVYFTEQTIKDIAEDFLAKMKLNNTNIEHKDDTVTTKNTLVESWLVEDPEKDKSSLYGFEVPKGTWMVKYKINDDLTWQKIKSGKLRGLSVEGLFVERGEAVRANELVRQQYETILEILKQVD